MPKVEQFYGEPAPLSVPSSPAAITKAWRSHRARFRTWIEGLDGEDWLAATRCSAWNVSQVVQHLASGSQFLGYTLHQANKGEATRLLQSFDPQTTPGDAARMFAGLPEAELLEQLRAVDAQVDAELERSNDAAMAESPIGSVPAHLSVNHFLYDSWVHERDLMLPLGDDPLVDPEETAVVSAYVLALAALARTAGSPPPAPRTILLHLTDLDRYAQVDVGDGVRVTWAAAGPANVAGTSADITDKISGRTSQQTVVADGPGTDFLDHFATLMG